MTGDAQMLDATGTAQSDLDLTGTVFIRGELWSARSEEKISQDTRVRVKSMEGLILVVEPIADSRLPIESPSGGETK
jgi:membrane-bound serine protease (ClpP class)